MNQQQKQPQPQQQQQQQQQHGQELMKAAIYYGFGQPIQIEYIPKPIASVVANEIALQNQIIKQQQQNNQNQNQNHQQRMIKSRAITKQQQIKDDEIVIVIKVMATGVCRSDWHGWKGHDTDIINHGLPFVPGHEVSGIIVDIASVPALPNSNTDTSNKYTSINSHANSTTVTNQQQQHNTTTKQEQQFKIGDRVVVSFILSCGQCYCCSTIPIKKSTVCCYQKQPGFTQYGSYAEYVVIPRANINDNVCIIPTNVSFVQAASLGCRFTTAYRAVVQQGNYYNTYSVSSSRISSTLSSSICSTATTSSNFTSIAVFGCGGLGLSCIMIAKAIASKQSNKNTKPIIIAIDISKKALQKALEIGATHAIWMDPSIDTSVANDTVRKQIYTLSPNNIGIDICIEASGYINSCENAIYCTRRGGGKLIQVGLFDTSSNQKQPINIPMNIIAGREIELIGSHGFISNDLPLLLNMISTNELNPLLLIENEVSLQDGVDALQRMDYESPLGITMITKFHNNDNDNNNDCDIKDNAHKATQEKEQKQQNQSRL